MPAPEVTRAERKIMYAVFEVFDDGKRFLLFEHNDRFTCEVYARNHQDATTALRNGWSKLMILKRR